MCVCVCERERERERERLRLQSCTQRGWVLVEELPELHLAAKAEGWKNSCEKGQVRKELQDITAVPGSSAEGPQLGWGAPSWPK